MKSDIIRLGNVATKATFNEAVEAAKAAEITLQYSTISEALNPNVNKILLVEQRESN